MKQYRISFIGREINAIGIRYGINETIFANNRDDAILKLYEKYEHIQIIKTISEE